MIWHLSSLPAAGPPVISRVVPALWQLGIISEVSGKKSVLSRASEINGIHGLDVVSTKHDGNHRE